MKWHFLSSVLFVIVLTMQAMTENRNLRMILLVPDLVLFYATLILFAFDYDKEKIEYWKKREQELIEKTYSKFFNKNHKK